MTKGVLLCLVIFPFCFLTIFKHLCQLIYYRVSLRTFTGRDEKKSIKIIEYCLEMCMTDLDKNVRFPSIKVFLFVDYSRYIGLLCTSDKDLPYIQENASEYHVVGIVTFLLPTG